MNQNMTLKLTVRLHDDLILPFDLSDAIEEHPRFDII
jgi:hypothetical protein